ncbi:ABC transporter permease [Pedobacter helvus]|uniref:ABC transporter permease n=1 Tax=Pedobacter helvus TaxID=2563444 RepID=A0ABW9JFH0_9SPHI|nr:FtsX-like permease family protein [Pedobacter ureilyticus]
MNVAYFISRRISLKAERTFSKLIVRIAIAGVMLSLAVMILSVAIIKGFKTEIQDKVRGFVGDIQIYRYDLNGSFEKSPFIPNDTTLNHLKNNKEIAAYYPFATKPAIIVANGEVEGINFKGIDRTYNWDYIKKHLVSGKIIDFTDSTKSAQQILISDFTARRLMLKTGDTFIMHFVQNPPRKRKMTIVGIYHIGIENLDKGFVIGDLALIRRLNNWQANETGGIEVRIKDFKLLKPVADDVYSSLELKLRSRSVEESTPEIFTWLSLLDVNTNVILTLMLIVGVINMITALLIMILERTNMIGILKAMGMPNSSMMKIFLYNAIYLVSLGLLMGNILGLGLCYLQQYTHLFKLDQANYYLDYVPIEVHFIDVLLLNLVTIVICALVLIIPSMLVSRISPLKAIRFK